MCIFEHHMTGNKRHNTGVNRPIEDNGILHLDTCCALRIAWEKAQV